MSRKIWPIGYSHSINEMHANHGIGMAELETIKVSPAAGVVGRRQTDSRWAVSSIYQR